MHQTKIEKLVHGGQGLGYTTTGQTAFIWNALPGEEVIFEIIRKKNGVVEGVATEILSPSPHRVAPQEDFYLSTSPWQIMTYDYENQMKQAIAIETYNHLGSLNLGSIEITSLPITLNYRNKMEYSFHFDDQDQWHLGFFQRGTHRKRPTGVSILAQPPINIVAQKILEAIRSEKTPVKTLKSLILRIGNQNQVIAGLFIKEESAFPLLPIQALEQISELAGFKIYYSRPLSPASTTDKLLHQWGGRGGLNLPAWHNANLRSQQLFPSQRTSI